MLIPLDHCVVLPWAAGLWVITVCRGGSQKAACRRGIRAQLGNITAGLESRQTGAQTVRLAIPGAQGQGISNAADGGAEPAAVDRIELDAVDRIEVGIDPYPQTLETVLVDLK